MNDQSLLEVTPSDCLRFIKTSEKTVGYLYLRNKAETGKLILLKVKFNDEVDFSQARAFRIDQTYVMLKPRQGIRLNMHLIESEIDPSKKNTIRIQANELKRIALHKFESENELRDEWKSEKNHYEGPSCQKFLIPCILMNKIQPTQNIQVNYLSGKSQKSILEEAAELSLYPQVGFNEERSIRSRNFSSSPGYLANSLKPLGPQQSNSREEEHPFLIRNSIQVIPQDAFTQDRRSLCANNAYPQLLDRTTRLSIAQTKSEQPFNPLQSQDERTSIPIRRVKTEQAEADMNDLIEQPHSRKAEHSGTQPSTTNGRSRSRL